MGLLLLFYYVDADVAAVLVGKSTHNQRIERLWRDVFISGCLHHFYQLFHLLEDNGYLNVLCPTQLFALQYVFLPRINASLSAWCSAWTTHRIRTTSSSPLQLWVAGQLQNPVGMDFQPQVTISLFYHLFDLFRS